MPLRNIFKKKRTNEEPAKVITEKKEIEKEKPLSSEISVKSQKGKEKIISQTPERSEGERRTNVLRTPIILKSLHITEKATDLVKKNQYVFRVVPKANKTEIKKAIESLYGVDVLNVKIINIPKKQRRLGKQIGWRKGYKKTIVKIKEGQKIEVLPR